MDATHDDIVDGDVGPPADHNILHGHHRPLGGSENLVASSATAPSAATATSPLLTGNTTDHGGGIQLLSRSRSNTNTTTTMPAAPTSSMRSAANVAVAVTASSSLRPTAAGLQPPPPLSCSPATAPTATTTTTTTTTGFPSSSRRQSSPIMGSNNNINNINGYTIPENRNGLPGQQQHQQQHHHRGFRSYHSNPRLQDLAVDRLSLNNIAGGGGGVPAPVVAGRRNPEQGRPDDTDQAGRYEDDDDGSGDMMGVKCSNVPPPPSGWSVVVESNNHDNNNNNNSSSNSTPPSARSLHAAAILNGVMYVFGGYDGTVRVNTFHAYSFVDRRWSPVLPSAGSDGPPSPRDRHVAFAYGNSIFVHGGFDGIARVADFWSFDLSSMTWREVTVLAGGGGGGRPPSPRHSHSASVYRHSLWIYGGYDGAYKSDLHEFDFSTSQWHLVPTTGRRPRARYRATTVVHKNYMLLYGGHDGNRHLSDTHVFDFETRSWSSLVTEGINPTPRDSHIAVVHSNSMYIFGGSSGTAMNDLHELQLPPNPSMVAKWRPVRTNSDDEPRCRFCHVGVVHNEALFVFGGYDGSLRLNDFIRFDFTVYDLSFEVAPSTLVSELRSLVDDETMSDVTFIVEGQPVYAHKLMLMRSSYFRALFLGEMMEANMSTVRIELVSHPIFLQVLEYLYTDQLRIPLESAMELFEAADLFCIPRLKTICEKRMLQSISVENAATIFHASDMHSALALRSKAKKYILSHFEEVSKTASFEDMGRRNIDLLFELLQSR